MGRFRVLARLQAATQALHERVIGRGSRNGTSVEGASAELRRAARDVWVVVSLLWFWGERVDG